MTTAEAQTLLGPAVDNKPGQQWLELGAGSGTFTTALAGLLDASSEILATDKDPSALMSIKSFPDVRLITTKWDFMKMGLPAGLFDGILMANALHYVQDKEPLIRAIIGRLKDDGMLIIIEYDMTAGNRWVPYPVSYRELAVIAQSMKLRIDRVSSKPSTLKLSNIYSAKLQLI